MTPEQSIERAVRQVGVPCGHWPYTERLTGVAIGWRPKMDSFSPGAGNRPLRVQVSYDVVIIRTRSAGAEAERTRFALYRALRESGWAISSMGPETYIEEQKRHYWPLVASRGFALDADGQPYDLRYTEEGDA